MAVEPTFRLHLRHPHHLFLVEHNILVLVGWRPGPYRLSDDARISRWYVFLVLHDVLTLTVL